MAVLTGLPSVPAIFVITVFVTVALVFGATLIGRYISGLLPARLRPAAKFYLAPALGLAFLTVAASIVGRWLPLGNGLVAVPLSLIPLIWAWLNEPIKRRAVAHALSNGLVALAPGVIMLAPLLVYGGFNAHNDAFTYLAHSEWLQDHAFSETIEPGLVTPLTTQIALYKYFGFRMGGSYLIALVQSVFGLKWSYYAYPAVIIAALYATCLSVGFPLAAYLKRFPRNMRMLALCLPAYGFGGLVFAASYGFLPQTVGMTFACSLLFLSGPVFKWTASLDRGDVVASLKPAILSALLLSAMIFAYSEFLPFVGLVIAIVAIAVMIQTRKLWAVIVYGLAVLSVSLLLLNTEILRAYSALKLQSGAVVGTPVDWTLLGFVGHAFGVHGGAWDVFQWALPSADWASFSAGLLSFAILVALVAFSASTMLKASRTSFLLPTAAMLLVCALGLLYFRYKVASPFAVGIGQSWSQFKLADWAHPFLSVFVLLALLLLLSRLKAHRGTALAGLFVVALLGAASVAVERVRPVAKSYGKTRDLAQFYLDLRQAVLTSCSTDAPVYLALGDRDQKFKQIATLFLPDRQVLADWLGDDYVQAFLPEGDKRRQLSAGECVVERQSPDQISSVGSRVGAFSVGPMPLEGRVRIGSVEGAHEQESNGEDWWRWVEREAVFQLKPVLVARDLERTRITFTFQTRGPQTITLTLESDEANGNQLGGPFTIESSGEAVEMFDRVVDVRPSDIRRLRVTTDGIATPLQAADPRLAAWRIQNLHLEPM
ncbi:hypothetical protein [Rhizobium sp. L245/93]|uniref:hypothetical protein n=1 Tax=Rhizobium sp. L245/93 TaxID=2819998 RepID=UPI001ADB870F|nr:hypothetical protein [Rhizobium sp. L245/93]MBO9170454.1 hypothetical protein [Rhizobium sp. L245/93]